MKELNFNASFKTAPGVSVMAIRDSISGGNLASVSGNESLEMVSGQLAQVSGMEGFGDANVARVAQAGLSRDKSEYSVISETINDGSSLNSALKNYAGTEGFSLTLVPGEEKHVKATNLALNAQTHRQTEAAEALYKTIVIPYETEALKLSVRAAGIGSYVSGASAYQRSTELRPIFGLLRTGDIFRDDTLRVYPVFPTETSDALRSKFVADTDRPARDIVYPGADPYGRQAHQTQMLKVPVKLQNLLGLCQAPGQRDWTTTDEIEASAISVTLVQVKGTFNGNSVSFFIDTGSMTNNTFGVTTLGQSSDERGLNLAIKNLPASAILDKDLVSDDTVFDALAALSYEPLLSFTLTGTFNRSTNEFELGSGSASITALRSTTDETGTPIPLANIEEADVKTLAYGFDGTVTGADIRVNMNNTSHGNFGYRIDVYDKPSQLYTRRRSPVSVKYPVEKQDVNTEALDFAVEQMSIAINNQCSRDAFDAAADHYTNIRAIDGQGVVSNNQGSNVLPGQLFVTAAAVERKVTLADIISITSNEDLFPAISSVLVNEISDIVAALETKSGVAAIREYGGIADLKWNVVTHQNLARFFLRQGDFRTIGGFEKVEIVTTNFDSMIGEMYVVLKDETGADNINPLAGIGVNVSKENITVQGNMHREQQQYSVIMTIPSYRHWSLCPIIGKLTVTDAEDLLGDEGFLNDLAKLRITPAVATGFKVDTEETEEINPNA